MYRETLEEVGMIIKKEKYALKEVGTITNEGNTIFARYDKDSAEPPISFNDLNLKHQPTDCMKKRFVERISKVLQYVLVFLSDPGPIIV